MNHTTVKQKSRTRKKKTSSIRYPRSAYNFFFKHQRSCILGELEQSLPRPAVDNRSSSLSGVQGGIPTNSDRSLTLRKSIFNQDVAAYLLEIDYGTCRDKKHRKTHGMINLKELTQSIAQRWKQIDAETKQQYQLLAERDKERYKREKINEHEKQQIVDFFDLIEKHNQVDEYTPRCVEEMLVYGPGNMVRGEEHLTKSDENYVMNILL